MKRTRPFFFFCYRFIALPLALGLLAPFLLLINKKFRFGLGLRLKQGPSSGNGRTLWLHCASGEFEYAKSIIREIKNRAPQTQILVSYFSPSYKKQIEKDPLVDHAQILPLDLAGPLTAFIKKFKPQALLVARSDLWPELLHQCEKQNIPTLLFSHTKSSSHWWLKGIEKVLYGLLTDIYVVSAADQEVIKRICDRTALVAGDTRYDQVLYRLKQLSKNPKAQIFKNRRFFIAGSTWSEDEALLVEALSQIESFLPTVFVPHEPSPARLAELEKRLETAGLASVRLSQTEAWPENQVLIVDELGLLADLYADCEFAFVGGSFKRKVHSVMEPLGANKPVIVGPFYKNNREAIQFSEIQLPGELMAVSVAHNSTELKMLMSKIAHLQKQADAQNMTIIKNEFTKRTGATQAVLAWLQQKGVLS